MKKIIVTEKNINKIMQSFIKKMKASKKVYKNGLIGEFIGFKYHKPCQKK